MATMNMQGRVVAIKENVFKSEAYQKEIKAAKILGKILREQKKE